MLLEIRLLTPIFTICKTELMMTNEHLSTLQWFLAHTWMIAAFLAINWCIDILVHLQSRLCITSICHRHAQVCRICLSFYGEEAAVTEITQRTWSIFCAAENSTSMKRMNGWAGCIVQHLVFGSRIEGKVDQNIRKQSHFPSLIARGLEEGRRWRQVFRKCWKGGFLYKLSSQLHQV